MQRLHTETLNTFTLPIETEYECIEEIQDIHIDLEMKAISASNIAKPGGARAIVIRHTFVQR